MKIDAFRFRNERTVGAYVTRETLLGQRVTTIGVSLWVGSIFVTVRR